MQHLTIRALSTQLKPEELSTRQRFELFREEYREAWRQFAKASDKTERRRLLKRMGRIIVELEQLAGEVRSEIAAIRDKLK